MNVEPTALDEPWVVRSDGDVCVLAFEGGRRRTMGIAAAAQLTGLVNDRAQRAEPPVLVLVIDVLHAELNEVLEMSAGRPIADWAPWVSAISAVEDYPVATVVAVPHQASCGGLELALAADVRVAAPDALLGVFETRIGLIPGAGGTQRLPGLVGRGNAALLALSGDPVSGVEAHRMGLVQLLDADPVARSVSLADRMAANGSAILAAAKRALRASITTTAEGFREEGRAFLSVVGRPESVETMTAWVRRQDADDSPALERGPLP